MSRIIAASKKPVWIALGAALLIHGCLISAQAGRRVDSNIVRRWILDLLAPAEKLVDRSLYGISNVWYGYIALVGARSENHQLKEQVDALRMQIGKEHEDVLEAERLRAFLSIQDARIGKTVMARVIGRDPARNQTITIDKGSFHGIKADAAVITPKGIVGRVIHASTSFSIVQLILDSQSGVGVLLQSTRHQGIVKGTGARELELDYIDDDNDLKVGDAFLTSGLDRIYPKGLPVGTIVTIGARRGLFKAVQVRPSADLGRLEEVICIVDRPQNVDAVDPLLGPLAP